MDKMREEFEDWYVQHKLKYDPLMIGKHVAWQAWQASRDALVVELPKPNVRMDVDIDDVRCALDELGIRYDRY